MIGELTLVMVSGLLGSAHCVGMCGGLAAMIGIPVQGLRTSLLRQFTYSVGRVFTYSTLGAMAGYLGVRLSQSSIIPRVVNIAAVLSILCGLLLIVEGLLACGIVIVRRKSLRSPCGGCSSNGMFAAFLKSPGLHHAFLAGILTGLLPCGLVYGFLALAAAERDPFRGMAVMAAFGVGTVPLMVATGLGAAALGSGMRRKLLRVAACCVVLTGFLTVYRGYGFLTASPQQTAADVCPFCATQPEVLEPATR
jgi:sulfite exporter TauE/SafE